MKKSVIVSVKYSFRHFCDGVAHYRSTVAWRPDSNWWKTFAVLSGGIVTMWFSVVVVAGSILACFSDNPIAVLINTLWFALVASIAGIFLGWFMAGPINSTLVGMGKTKEYGVARERRLYELRDLGWTMIVHCNPIFPIFWVVRGLKQIATRMQ